MSTIDREDSPLDPVQWPCGQSPCLNWDDHIFSDTYYGHQCEKCRLFYAFGCAPWEAA